MTIHSFDEVLRTPKSIHSVQMTPGGTSIPLWRPVSWISFIYFCVIEVVFYIATKVPVLDAVRDSFAGLTYYIAIPVALVWLAFYAELDGLRPHVWLSLYLRYVRRHKRTLCGRPVTAVGEKVTYAGRVSIWWDLHAPRLHRGWVTGGRITTSVPIRFTYGILHNRSAILEDERGRCAEDYEVRQKLQVRA